MVEKEFYRDPPQAEAELKISEDIANMPEAVRDRFKAIKVLYDMAGDLDEEEEKEYRALEVKYEKLYQEIYQQRALLVKGLEDVPAQFLEQYEFRAANLKADEKYKDTEVTPADVKQI